MKKGGWNILYPPPLFLFTAKAKSPVIIKISNYDARQIKFEKCYSNCNG